MRERVSASVRERVGESMKEEENDEALNEKIDKFMIVEKQISIFYDLPFLTTKHFKKL